MLNTYRWSNSIGLKSRTQVSMLMLNTSFDRFNNIRCHLENQFIVNVIKLLRLYSIGHWSTIVIFRLYQLWRHWLESAANLSTIIIEITLISNTSFERFNNIRCQLENQFFANVICLIKMDMFNKQQTYFGMILYLTLTVYK